MYSGLSKESGGIVGDGLLLASKDGEMMDLTEAAENTPIEESLVCLQVSEEGDATQVVMTGYVHTTSGEVSWKASESTEVFRRAISMSQMTSMLRDEDRNRVYETAIEKCIAYFLVKEGTERFPLVLDIGTGTGLLALMAARYGASVVACEMFETLASVANQTVSINGFADKIQIVASKSSEIEAGSFEADILVSETLDTALLGEGCILNHADALSRGLVRNADADDIQNRVIPNSAEIYVQLIYSEEVDRMKYVQTFSLSAERTRRFTAFRDSSASCCQGNIGMIPVHWNQFAARGRTAILSEAVCVLNVPFYGSIDVEKIRKSCTQIACSSQGIANAFLVWWKTYLLSPEIDPNREVWYSTAPGVQNWQDHWLQAVYPLATPIHCMPGKLLQVNAYRNALRMWFDCEYESEESIIVRCKRSHDGKNTLPVDIKEDIIGEDIDLSTVLPSVCSCGWHLLCNSNRIAEINDEDRTAAYQLAMQSVSTAFIAKTRVDESVNLIAMDIGDSSILSFMLGTIIASSTHSDCNPKIVSLEKKQFSSILSSQLCLANKLSHIIKIWDGVDFAEVSALLADQDEDDDDNTCQSMIEAESPQIVLLMWEDNLYQLKSVPIMQALSFYFTRQSLSARLHADCIVCPCQARIMVGAIELPNLSNCHGPVGQVSGFDQRPIDDTIFDWYTNIFPYKISDYRKRFLSAFSVLYNLNYQSASICVAAEWSCDIVCRLSGTVHAIALIVDYDLTADIQISDIILSTERLPIDFKPYSKSNLRFLERPESVNDGDKLRIVAKYDPEQPNISVVEVIPLRVS